MYKQIVIPFFFLAVVAFTFFVMYRMRKPAKSRLPQKRAILLLLFAWYLCGVAAITVVPIRASRTQNLAHHFNFVPVITSVKRLHYLSEVKDPEGLANFRNNFIGNILMFIPLGIFLPWLYGKRFKQVTVTAALISCCIEFIQYLNMFAGYYRYVDIDDVLLNTAGAILGYWIYKAFFDAGKNTGI